jgi:hypothetical protein
MAEGWKLEETETDEHGRPTSVVRRAFEAWCRANRVQINRVRQQSLVGAPTIPTGFPYVPAATRAAWRAWQGAIGALATDAPESLRVALALAVLKGDEAAAGALVDLLLEAGVGTGRKGG